MGALDGLEDGARGRHAELDPEPEGLPQIVQEQGIGRIGRGHGDSGAVDRHGAGRVLAEVPGREVLDHGRRAGQLIGRQVRQAMLGGEGAQHLFLGGRAHGHQRLTEPLALMLGAREPFLEDFGREDAGPE